MAFVLFNFLATATTPILASALSVNDKEKVSVGTICWLLFKIQHLTLGCVIGRPGYLPGVFAFRSSGDYLDGGVDWLCRRSP